MHRSPGRGLPRRRLSPEQQAAATEQRADRLLDQIRYWLEALEKFHNSRSAPRRAFTTTRCTGGGGSHWWHVRLVPPAPAPARQVTCTAPRDAYPDQVLWERVILPLRKAGFQVSKTTNHNCGCATFTASPRKLASE